MIKKSESIAELSKALVQTQKELKQPLKDADNPFFKSKYVPLENVVESITTAATKHGLGFTQIPTMDEAGLVVVGTMIVHESGEWIEYEPIKMKPVKNDPQAIGSAITYAKRYALSAIFGITSDQDDDGNEATQPSKQSKPTPKSKQVSQPKQQPKISKIQVETYKSQLSDIAQEKETDAEKIANWFMDHVGVTKIEDMTVDMIVAGDGLINKLRGKTND